MGLIVEGCHDGNFSRDMLQPRVLLGICLQLLMAMALGRLYRPGRPWQQASVRVLRSPQHGFVGFALLIWLDEPSPCGKPRAQISLFKVASFAQAQGLGQRMLSGLLAELPKGSVVQTECLPASRHMQKLLTRQGFGRLPVVRPGVERWQRTIG